MYLNCKTFFSYRYGTCATTELVAEAVNTGITSLALTNINNNADWWDFYALCQEQHIHGVLGTEIRNDDALICILLAKNNAGLAEINAYLTAHLQAHAVFEKEHQFSDHLWVIYPYGSKDPDSLRSNELIGIRPAQVNKLFSVNTSALQQKLVVWQPVTYKDKRGYNLHRLLRAIDKNKLLSKQLPHEIAGTDEYFVSPAQVIQAFSKYPFIVTHTLKVLDSCQYTIDLHTDKNKKFFSSGKADDMKLLEKLAMEGLRYRYGTGNRVAEERVKKELKIIDNLNFNAYFLITWDVIRYAQSRGFYYVGRGSGANSIVAYCLQITDVNPIDLDLYFERFLNPYRTSPPDFDLDFSWQDRDEVIDYIFKRYGKEHVALLGMYSTFQHNAIIRELAKVFGLPKAETDELLNNPKATFNDDRYQKQILFYGNMLINFPNHLSIHPGGMLISELPVYQYTALDMPPKGFATAQIDMFVAEKIGLFKLDILSQRGLGHIKEAIRLVRENKNIHVDIRDVERFKKDKKVAEQIKKADTIGCFYIESPAMRQLLLKLKCSDYITLVAASSIIRPGVSQSGMMRQYIQRFHQPETIEYLHPKMEVLLKETYGVMVYQEDVIKVAHHFAGLDMGEADVLRRAMSGKYRGRKEFEQIRENFFNNCKEFGYSDTLTAEVWRQIESFGGYSFSKAHSASFAVESYQSLFLKTYYPMEFMVAVINNFGGFYSTELYFHELRRTGARIHPPCVNNSQVHTSIYQKEVYMGFIHIKSLDQKTIDIILNERMQCGSFLSLLDFIERTQVGMEQLNILIRCGAFRFTQKNKKELLWQANFLNKRIKEPLPASRLFNEPIPEFQLPQLQQTTYEDTMDEIEIFGFTLNDPFHIADAPTGNFVRAADLCRYVNKQVELFVYYITQKPVRTKDGRFMQFGTFIDTQGDWVDTVHFPGVADDAPLTGKGFYHIKGKVVEDFGVYAVDVQWMRKTGFRKNDT